MPKKLLSGKSPDVIATNVKHLCSTGMSEKQATHLSLKHANKGRKASKSQKY